MSIDVQDDTLTHLEQRLSKALAIIVGLWPEMLLPTAKRIGSTGGGGTLLDDHAEADTDTDRTTLVIDARRAIAQDLRGWCQVIVQEHNVHHGIPTATDIPGMCKFLDRWRIQCTEHEAAQDLVDEVAKAARVVKGIARPNRATSLTIGACPLMWPHPDTDVDQQCTGTIRSCEGDTEDQSWLSCTDCGTRGVVGYWEKQMHGDEGVEPLTAAEVPGWAHRNYGVIVKRATIRKWVERGTIEPVDIGDDRAHRYDRVRLAVAIGAQRAG